MGKSLNMCQMEAGCLCGNVCWLEILRIGSHCTFFLGLLLTTPAPQWKTRMPMEIQTQSSLTKSLPSQFFLQVCFKKKMWNMKRFVHDFEELKHCGSTEQTFFFPTNQDFPASQCQFILKYLFSYQLKVWKHMLSSACTLSTAHPVKLHRSAVNL